MAGEKVEVVEDAPEIIVEGSAAADKGEADAIADLKAQIAAKSAEAASERTRREAAERATVEATSAASKNAGDAASAQEIAIGNAIAAATHAAGAAEQAYVEAMEGGQYAAAATAQRKMARAESDLREAERSKQNFEQWKVQQEERAKQQQGNEVEQRRAANRQWLDTRTPQTRQWLSSHPEAWSDEAGIAPAVAKAHSGAVYNDLQPDTPAYFEFIEKHLKGQQANGNGADPEPEPRAQGRQPGAAAPSSRSQPGAPPRGSIRLTAEQAEAAEIAYPKLPPDQARAKYAKALHDPLTQAQLKNRSNG